MPPVAPLPDAVRPERLLTAAEVAALLSVPVSWVREATRANHLPHLKLGRYRRYQRTAISAWLLGQQAGPSPPISPAHRHDLPAPPDPSL